MKVFFSFIIIIVTLYIIALFAVPEKVKELTKPFWFEKINNTIIGFKEWVDETATTLWVATGWILDNYGNIIWEAREVVEKVTSGSLEVKERIDGIRSTLSWAEATLNTTIETGNKVIETVNEVKDTLNDFEKIGEWVKNMVNTGAIQ